MRRALTTRRLLPLAALVLVALAQGASAQTDAYTIRGNGGPGITNNIWSVDLATGVETMVYANYLGGNAATIAQRPSDGMLFFSINATNGAVYRFNPATPNVAPVLLGNLGAGVSGAFRMAFNGNTLYYMIGNAGADANQVYTINQNTGQATALATVTNTNNGGDIAFLGNTLYIIDQNRRLCSYAGLPANGAAGGCATVNVAGASVIGIIFNSAGQMLMQTVNPSALYTIDMPGLGVGSSVALSGGNTATGDLAGAVVPAPNLSITKTVSAPTVYRGGPVSYTMTVTNSSAYAVTGAVIDNVPASVTAVNWACAATLPSFCAVTNGTGNAINTSVTLEPGASATFTVDGTISPTAATGVLTNQATVSVPAWLTDSNLANNTASVNTTVNLNANLGITKTDGLANVNPGATVTYTVVVSNAGPDASTGSIVTDTVPAALTGVTWTCGSLIGGATCGAANGSGNAISTTANLPSGGSVTYTITGTVAAGSTGSLSNTARVVTPAAGVTDPNDPTRTGAGNNSATDATTINLVSDVRVSKSHAGNFTVGVNGTYTLTASNAGNTPTTGTITVTDTLPTGLTVASIPIIANWNCGTTVVGSSLMTCTSATAIPAGANHPNPITLTVVVGAAAFAASPVTNVANISGGGEPVANNGNNSASDPTTIIGSPDLTIAKTHAGNFTRGSTTDSYTITVTNSGTAATSGATVTVTDTVPAGLTPTAPVGLVNGWTCGIAGQVVTCTRSNALAVGASYPVIPVTVTVSQTAANSVTNSVTVAGGGEPASLNGNNTATDPTTIVSSADLSLTKIASSSTPTVGQNVTFTLTVTNAGPTNATGITVRDQLPAGLTFVSATPAAAYNSATGVWTVGAVNSGANATLQIVATVTASGTITNTAQVTASGQPDPDSTPNNNAAAEDDQASAALNVAAPPAVALCKTFPGQTCTPPPSLPPQLPGADITFLIIFTNTGGSPAQGFVITDPIPANTDFQVGSMTASFAGTGLTGVTLNYSYNGGASYVTTAPTSGGGGAPAGYDRTVTHVRWVFTGSLSQAAPNNTGNVQFVTRIR